MVSNFVLVIFSVVRQSSHVQEAHEHLGLGRVNVENITLDFLSYKSVFVLSMRSVKTAFGSVWFCGLEFSMMKTQSLRVFGHLLALCCAWQ